MAFHAGTSALSIEPAGEHAAAARTTAAAAAPVSVRRSQPGRPGLGRKGKPCLQLTVLQVTSARTVCPGTAPRIPFDAGHGR